MYKIFLLIAIITVVGCQDKKNIVNEQTDREKLIQNAEPPKAKPALVVENYPISVVDIKLIKKPQTVGTARKWIIVGGTRVGDVTKNTTLAQLKSSYGARNVKDSDFSQGAKKFLTSKVFEGQPNEFEVYWSDTVSRKNPIMVKVTGLGDWRTTQGISVGSTLQELVAINRKDFYFLGFNNNEYNGIYNGKVKWNKGEVDNKIGVSLTYDNLANAKESFRNFRNLQPFPTNYPEVKDLGLTVKEISCVFR